MTNLPLKLTSLALAVLLWFAIAAEKTSEMGVRVPVELQNVPKELEVTGDAVDSVEVRLRASPGIIQRLSPGEVSAQLDLTGASEGERIVHLTGETIRVPFGVKVVKINPSIITLVLERTLQKRVPVRPRLIGRPAPGYEVAELTSEPPDVTVAGPRSRVLETESAFTEPVSVEGARKSVSESVNIGLDDPMLRVQGEPRVRVVVKVREELERRTLDRIALSVRNGAALLRPAAVRVRVAGPSSLLSGLKPADLRAYVDAAGLLRPEERPVTVELAPGHEGLTIELVDPARVTAQPVPGGKR